MAVTVFNKSIEHSFSFYTAYFICSIKFIYIYRIFFSLCIHDIGIYNTIHTVDCSKNVLQPLSLSLLFLSKIRVLLITLINPKSLCKKLVTSPTETYFPWRLIIIVHTSILLIWASYCPFFFFWLIDVSFAIFRNYFIRNFMGITFQIIFDTLLFCTVQLWYICVYHVFLHF